MPLLDGGTDGVIREFLTCDGSNTIIPLEIRCIGHPINNETDKYKWFTRQHFREILTLVDPLLDRHLREYFAPQIKSSLSKEDKGSGSGEETPDHLEGERVRILSVFRQHQFDHLKLVIPSKKEKVFVHSKQLIVAAAPGNENGQNNKKEDDDVDVSSVITKEMHKLVGCKYVEDITRFIPSVTSK